MNNQKVSVKAAIRNFIRERPLNLRKDWRMTCIATRNFLNHNKWICLISLLCVIAISIFVVQPSERQWLDWIRGTHLRWNQNRHDLASNISHWGDFAQFNLILFGSLWLFGYLRSARWFQRLAFASLVAAILAGLTCNVFRLTIGRPRPNAGLQDGFYGIAGTIKGWDYHSFPSGHTSTAFGSGIPVAVASPWGTPALLMSGGVAWARMYKNKHFPTDVLIGAYLGIVFGLATGWRLRQVRLRLRRRKRYRLSLSQADEEKDELPEEAASPRQSDPVATN